MFLPRLEILPSPGKKSAVAHASFSVSQPGVRPENALWVPPISKFVLNLLTDCP